MPPQRRSPFPQSARSAIWNQIVAALRNDPVLHMAVDTWQLWDGSEEATVEPTEENLPLLRMTPSGGTQKWLDENAQQCTMNLTIDIGVEGTTITDVFDFWSQVEVALFTGNAVLERLYTNGAIQKTITSPAITPRMFGAKAGLAAQGVLTILMRINS
jgi:hypothetical protein